MNYDDYVATMRNMLVSPLSGAETLFTQILPRMIEYAELRIYRELDLLSTVSSLSTTLTANLRNVTLPPSFVVLQDANVITPVTAITPDAGTRNQLTRVSLSYLNAVYGSSTSTTTPSIPSVYTLLEDHSVRVGPPPDRNYTIEFIGTVRPDPLSPDNTETVISTYLPDLFISASMIFGAGYRQNFGQASDDPRMAISWEQVYQKQAASADVEEIRKKSMALAGTSVSPQSKLGGEAAAS